MRIVLVPHDPAWARMARAEGRRLARAIGPGLIAVHHIGSTAIPGIRAKPIVDLLPEVTSLAVLEGARRRLEALGYEWMGAFGIRGRRYLRRDGPDGPRLFNVHGFAMGTPGLERHFAFRDFLRANPARARAYEAAKRRARALHPDDVEAYNRAKEPWIKATEAEALAWYHARA